MSSKGYIFRTKSLAVPEMEPFMATRVLLVTDAVSSFSDETH